MKRQFLTPSGEIIEVESKAQSRQFAAPVPYFELSPADVDALEAERKQLLDSLPTLLMRDRLLAEDRIQRIEFDLRRARSGTETSRRDGEREQERIREQTGDPNRGSNPTSGNTTPAVNWSAMDMATRTTVIQAAMKELQRVGAVSK